MVLGLCRVLLRDTEEAEDAAQQTFVDAHRALLGGVAVRDDPAWLAAIARNECRARIAARMREPLALSYEDLVEAAGASTPEEYEVLSDDVRRALAELPEQQREAIVLRDVYGLRYREVGVVLGLSRPAVESVLFRARRRLRQRLRPVAGSFVVPIALRDNLAQMLPGFAGGEGGAAVVGAAGATGVLVKLGSGPIAAKLAAGVVAVGAGSGSLAVALGDGDRVRPPENTPMLGAGRATADDGQLQHAVESTGVAMSIDHHRGRRADARADERGPGLRAAGGPREAGPRGHGGPGNDAADPDDSSGSGGPRSSGTEHRSSRSGQGDDASESGSPEPDPATADEERGEQTSGSPNSGSGSGGSGSGGSGSGGSGPGPAGLTAVVPPPSGFEGSGGSGEGSGTSPPQPSSSGPGSSGDAVVVEDSSGSGSGSGSSTDSGSGTGDDD